MIHTMQTNISKIKLWAMPMLLVLVSLVSSCESSSNSDNNALTSQTLIAVSGSVEDSVISSFALASVNHGLYLDSIYVPTAAAKADCNPESSDMFKALDITGDLVKGNIRVMACDQNGKTYSVKTASSKPKKFNLNIVKGKVYTIVFFNIRGDKVGVLVHDARLTSASYKFGKDIDLGAITFTEKGQAKPSKDALEQLKIDSTIVAVPKNFKPTAGDGKVTLEWSKVAKADSYAVFYDKTDTVSPIQYMDQPVRVNQPKEDVPVTVTVPQDKSDDYNKLTNNTTYYFVVVAYIGSGQSLPSDHTSAIPQLPDIIINDTGITRTGNVETGNDSDCKSDNTFDLAQDCHYGRDKTSDDDDGKAGFRFTRLDSNGDPSASDATSWKCVRDENTRLIWEVKTDTDGVKQHVTSLHDGDDTFSWYNPDEKTNGRYAGVSNTSGCFGYDHNKGEEKTHCNTQAYIARVNEAGFCGGGIDQEKQWRLPNINELIGLVDYGRSPKAPAIAIDMKYFPGTKDSNYWTSNPVSNGLKEDEKTSAVWVVNFGNGGSTQVLVKSGIAVRLVRDADEDK